MLKEWFKLFSGLLLLPFLACGQVKKDWPTVGNDSLDGKIKFYLSNSVPFLTVDELKDGFKDYVLLDTRTEEEYNVGCIPGAIFVGEKLEELPEDLDEDTPIVLYCSIGYRSEKAGERLIEKGYKNVYNLYGSIFEWVNKGYKIEHKDGSTSDTIHTYNKRWSKFITNDSIQSKW